MTNAQSALQAAATLYNGRSGYTVQDVLLSVDAFKTWLDDQDRADKTKRPEGPSVGFTRD